MYVLFIHPDNGDVLGSMPRSMFENKLYEKIAKDLLADMEDVSMERILVRYSDRLPEKGVQFVQIQTNNVEDCDESL